MSLCVCVCVCVGGGGVRVRVCRIYIHCLLLLENLYAASIIWLCFTFYPNNKYKYGE